MMQLLLFHLDLIGSARVACGELNTSDSNSDGPSCGATDCLSENVILPYGGGQSTLFIYLYLRAVTLLSNQSHTIALVRGEMRVTVK